MASWEANPACAYTINYPALFAKIADGSEDEIGAFRWAVLNDLFFILQFILEIPAKNTWTSGDEKIEGYFCNHPFVVERCKEVQGGPDGWCMDLWSRGFFKSTTKTIARTIQRVVKSPDRCTMIASHTRPAAKKFFRSIMLVLENNKILKTCFPDVLWDNPRTQAPKWSEDDGIVVKRRSTGRPEATVEAWGIKEGMPIGVHFDWILLDDLETKDDVINPDVVNRVRESIDITEDLLTGGGSVDITGTPYSHNGVYIPYMRDKVTADGKPAFRFRRHAATEDGTRDGKSIFLPQKVLDNIRARKTEYMFATQQLCNPTPTGQRKLDSKLITECDPREIPKGLFKFIMIDPAGDDAQNKSEGDDWAILGLGVEPRIDDLGASNVCILDAVVEPLRAEDAPMQISRMFRKLGLVMLMGIESAGASLVHNYVTNILHKEHGIYLSEDLGNLVILKPGRREKTKRIENAIAYPLFNGKIYMSKEIPQRYRQRIKDEMDQFPFWHPNALDALSYLYDVLPEFRFPHVDDEDEDDEHKVVSMQGRSKYTGY